jgi:hypothetical protein
MAKSKKPTEAAQTPVVDDPTPEERLHTVRSVLRHKIETSRTMVASLATELADPDRQPHEVLAWSTRAFEAAAVLQVALGIEQRLDTGESLIDVHASLQSEALRSARSGTGSSSTSPINNFTAVCRTAALAEFEEFLRFDAMKLSKMESKS